MTMYVDPASLAEAPKRRTKKTGGGADLVAPAKANAKQPAASPAIGNRRPICEAFLSEPHQETIKDIVELHRQRQGLVKAQTKLAIQAQATIRRLVSSSQDYGDEAALKKSREAAKALYEEAKGDPLHPRHKRISPYLEAIKTIQFYRGAYEKDMVRLAKRLPVYPWVKGVHGLGDMSFATIVGEAGDLGKYRDHSALWKRLGVAVIDGTRQGNPGAGASADLWIWHGYSKTRRSTVWNAGNGIIGGMGNGPRLMPDECPDSRDDLSPYQRLFVKRLREEAPNAPFKSKNGGILLDEKGQPVTVKIADNGKESFSKYATARAKRYVEKKMLRDLYHAWREAKA